MWNPDSICELARRALQEREQELRIEQAVAGLDSLEELALHAVLRRGLSPMGTVLSEVPFPGDRASRAQFRDRERCDLVLLPDGYDALRDPVADNREQDRIADTLFAGVLGSRKSDSTECATRDAYWLEVKVAHQFHTADAEARPNRGYASQVIPLPARDIRKLSRDPLVAHAGVLLIVFCDREATAKHDIAEASHRFLSKELPIRTPIFAGLAIADRIGHSWCELALFDLRCEAL